MSEFKIAGYGWRPDRPDARDQVLVLRSATLLPRHIDMRVSHAMPPVYQQGDLGSCTANCIGAAVQYVRHRAGLTPDFVPSRLMIYYGEREFEGSINWDAGAEIRDGIKFCVRDGVCDEQLWPYQISQFKQRPPVAAYTEAAKHQITGYKRVEQSLGALQSCLAAGYPFVFGFSVYNSFETQEVTRSGMVPMPNLSTEHVVGGHAVMCCGYNSKGRFLVRNSWGPNWGDAGYGWFPFEFLTNQDLCSDFWMINALEA